MISEIIDADFNQNGTQQLAKSHGFKVAWFGLP